MSGYTASPAALSAVGAPLALAAQGHFWVGLDRVQVPAGTVLSAPMYVEYQIPAELTQPWPVVMVHGGGGKGSYYRTTPDGRPGWTTRFLQQGYAVYVVDRPGHGRSTFQPETMGAMTPPTTFEWAQALFAAPEQTAAYPQAKLHDQWPGEAVAGNPVFDAFMAEFGVTRVDMAETHRDMQRCGVDLLEHIGPAILLTHSMGGPFGWLVADARPDLVKAIVAVEPIGPAFSETPVGRLTWGLTAIPMSFDPPATTPDELTTSSRAPAAPDLTACLVQADPARSLPHLRGIPVVVVVGEASWMAQDAHGTTDFLEQAGVPVELLRLEQSGIHGNGHMMMAERNSDEIAARLHAWIVDRLGRNGA